MIKVDALSFLLLIEALAILLVLNIVLAFKYRTCRNVRLAAVRELEATQRELAELRSRPSEAPGGTDELAPGLPATEVHIRHSDDEIKRLMDEKEGVLGRLRNANEELAKKDKLLRDLQAKLDNLEKEYLILYRQQQQQSGEQV